MTWPLAKSPLETCIIPLSQIRIALEERESDNLFRAHCVASRIGDAVYADVLDEIGGRAAAVAYTAVYRAVYEEMMK